MTRTEAIAAIRERRTSAGLSQKAAAELAGISQQAWGNAEAGERSLSPETILRMAQAVGLRLKYEPERFARSR